MSNEEPAAPVAPPRLAPGCSAETRIRNYAGQIAAALGVSPSADLNLFDADGHPRPNLLPVAVAMSGVELGYLHADPELVRDAIARLAARPAEGPSAKPRAVRP